MDDVCVDPSLTRELDKLKKAELIELIIKNKVPDAFNSDVINKFLLKRSEVKLTSSSDKNLNDATACSCDKQDCVQVYYGLQNCKYENSFLEKNIQLLQQRITDLEYIIELLKLKEDNFNMNTVTVAPSSAMKSDKSRIRTDNVKSIQMPSASTSAKNEPKNSHHIDRHTTSHKKHKHAENKDTEPQKQNTSIHTFTMNEVNAAIKSSQEVLVKKPIISYNPRQRKPIVGINKNNSNVRTVPKLGYLHVYRLDPATTPQELKNCLSKTASQIPFNCEVLNKTERTCSMKVSFPIQYVKEVYNPEIWPDGALVNRFRFINRNFPTQASESRQDMQTQ